METSCENKNLTELTWNRVHLRDMILVMWNLRVLLPDSLSVNRICRNKLTKTKTNDRNKARKETKKKNSRIVFSRVKLTCVRKEVPFFKFLFAWLKSEVFKCEAEEYTTIKPQPDTSKGLSLALLPSPHTNTNITNGFITTFLTLRHFKQMVLKVRLKVEFQSPLCVLYSSKRKQKHLLRQINLGNPYQAL
jgi:hypothetical protein